MVGLRLDFTPVQPSQLRHSFTPRSPASPLESTAKRTRYTKDILHSDSSSESGSSTNSWSSDPPPSPYKWMWYCHQCRTGYELGVTRRCLIDDHELCYGQPIKKRSKKGKKKSRACQSEFDYVGWENYGAWKRVQNGQDSQDEAQVERNCAALCDWPSQCRWARKQEQLAKESCHEAVEEAAPQTQEDCAATANELTTPAQKSADSPISMIRTATQKLTSQWTSLLAPIEEEPASGSIEDFLGLAKAKTNPTAASKQADVSRQDSSMSDDVLFVTPLEIAEDNGNATSTISKVDTKSNAFGFDFDFGFNRDVEEEAPPSIVEGLHDLVAGTVGIALSIPSSAPSEQDKNRGRNGRKCVSAPPSLGMELPEQLQAKRRMSARSI
ncbi:MAG: hypothetical protein Q9225_002861 [Loekoesia sp. 1 TL-2023]